MKLFKTLAPWLIIAALVIAGIACAVVDFLAKWRLAFGHF
jgi:hypothetical protein